MQDKTTRDTPKRCATASAEVRVFCETVSDSTTSSITLLKAIEQTVGWLTLLQNRAKADYAFASKAAEDLKTCERVKPIDPDGTLCVILEQVEEGLEKLYHLLIKKRNAAVNAPELKDDHKTSVVDEYTSAISAIADLRNSMADLKWAVGEYDADLEKPTDLQFVDKQELKAYLKTL